MSRFARAVGIARSAGIYYGIPFRSARMRQFYAQFVSPGDLCFDIGSHLGNRVRCWRALGARVVAVEPQRDLFRVLRWMYGKDPGITLLRCAIGRSAGETELRISERHPTLASVSPDWIERVKSHPGFESVEWVRTESVGMRTLDMLIAEFGRPRFVKIDVEGHEAEVLAGLTTPVPALSFECLPVAREIALTCVDRLAQLGDYRFNWSSGERHRLVQTHWFDAVDTRRFIAQLPAQADSGDIYAQCIAG